jgi:PKD repeat protein
LFAWNFGPDASPDTSINAAPVIEFSTPGPKTGSLTVTNASGCATHIEFTFNIMSCTPVIPPNARIVTDNESGSDLVVWIKAGGTYSAVGDYLNQQFFVDPGGQLQTGWRTVCLAYIGPGASLTDGTGAPGLLNLVLTPGTNINCEYCDTFYCPSLSYSLGVNEDNKESPAISFSQSPDDLYIRCEGEPLELRLMNVLGEEVLRHSATGELDCDLTPLASGVYFAVVQSGTRREIRKIVR